MNINPCAAAAAVGMDIIRQIRVYVYVLGMDVVRDNGSTATLKIYVTCEESRSDPGLRGKILAPMQGFGPSLSVVDHGRSSEFSGEVVRDGVTVRTAVFLRQAGIMDTTKLNGPGLVGDVVGDITSSGGTVRSCLWQVLPGGAGEPADEHVWARFECDAWTPVRERLRIAGWETRDAYATSWLVYGSNVTTDHT